MKIYVCANTNDYIKIKIAFIITFLFAIISVSGQRNLSKEEILKFWNSSSDNNIIDSSTVVNSDSSLNVQLLKFIDSLHSQKNDSIIVFSTSYPGYLSNSKCDTGMFPITTFIIWDKDGKTYIRSMQGSCVSDVNEKLPLHLFDFYKRNYNKMKSESFMPAILGGQVNKKGTIIYSKGSVDHEPCYSFYYRIGNVSNSFHFRESYIDDKESLFQKYNLNLAIYQWWLSVKNRLDEIQ